MSNTTSTILNDKKSTASSIAKTDTNITSTNETVSKPAEIKSEIYVQYRNREALTDEIIERVKAHYAARNHTEPIEKIQVYLNIVESTAYYVINDRVFDKINMFA